MVCHVYILQSESTGRLYIGQTKDVSRRLHEHQSGQSRSTRGRGPWRLIYEREFPTRPEAVRHERWLKSLKSPQYVLEYVEKQ